MIELVIIEATKPVIDVDMVKFLNQCGYSKSEARRLLRAGAVDVWTDGKAVKYGNN